VARRPDPVALEHDQVRPRGALAQLQALADDPDLTFEAAGIGLLRAMLKKAADDDLTGRELADFATAFSKWQASGPKSGDLTALAELLGGGDE
jgi:hypothetical protein